MIKAIIFDVGGVYMQGSCLEFINRSYKILGIDKVVSSSDGVIFDSDYNKGIIGHRDCFRKFFNVEITEDQMKMIEEAWTTTWAPTEEMLELVKSLKKDYTLAILSNSDLLNSTKYTKQGWYSHFDHLVLSHEIGIIKPDRRIYEIMLEKLKLSGGECVFIDDQERVLAPARELGMEIILFKSINQLKSELRKREVEC